MVANIGVDPSLPTSPTSFTSAHSHLPHDEASAIINRIENSRIAENDVTTSPDTPQASQSEERSAPGIPIRTSSNSQTRTLTSPPSQPAASEPRTISKKASKDSIKEKRRSGSLASARSSKEKAAVPVAAEQEKTGPTLAAPTSTEKPKKRGFGSFLSKLGCCGAQDDAKSPDTSDPGPPKKIKEPPSNVGRQPTSAPPVAGKGLGDNKTSESKEDPEETIGGTPYDKQKDDAKPKMITRQSEPKVQTRNPNNPGNGQIGRIPKNADSALPSEPTSETVVGAPMSEDSSVPPVVPIPPPNPITTVSPSDEVAEQGEVINDRTAGQAKRDSDVEMTTAPPTIPEAGGIQRSEEPETQQIPQQTQASLPPPPPPPSQNRGTSPAQRSSTNERQQWLLPPIQPRFHGKKCLVLDLDETLVHSSFKVNQDRYAGANRY